MKKYIIKLLKYLYLYKGLRAMLIAIKHVVKYRRGIRNRFIFILLSRFKKGISLSHELHGSTHNLDGYYVYPDMLNEHSIVYSFGIGNDISFDTSIINRHNCKVFGFDLNPRSIAWVERNTMPEKFLFYGYGIASQTGTATFYSPKSHNESAMNHMSAVNHDDVSDECIAHLPVKSLTDIMKELSHDHIDVLKIDIEGAEFEVIEAILHSPIYSSIGQIIIEFHESFFNLYGKTIDNMHVREVLSSAKLPKTRRIVTLLKEHGFEIFAQYGNTVQCLSFIKVFHFVFGINRYGNGGTISFINTRRLNQ